MTRIAITGTGVFTPSQIITNAELVEAFNEHARRFNELHSAEIATGSVQAKPMSSEEFIVKASGIEQRHVMEKEGVLDPDRMYPRLRPRADDELSGRRHLDDRADRERDAPRARSIL